MWKYLLTICAIFCLCLVVRAADKDARPNIVFMMVDDMGKEWAGCFGGKNIQTPNIDRLADGGMKFNHVYSMPQCVPTRMCLLTGQYPATNGWVDHWDPPLWGRAYLDASLNPTVGNVLRSAGYKTCAVGKWQLSDTNVMPHTVYDCGFDEYFLWARSHDPKDKNKDGRYWSPRFFHGKGPDRHRNEIFKDAFGPDLVFDFATDFMRRNKNERFFVYYAFNLVHYPLVRTPLENDAGKGLTGKAREHAMYAAMVRYMDHLTGKMVAFLEAEGLRKNTIIIWTTDNGSPGRLVNERDGRMVRGGKTKTTEPGVDAPFVVNCPGCVPVGVTTDALVDFTDMLPTFADFAGAPLPKDHKIDGVPQADLFTGKSKTSARKWIAAMGGLPMRQVNEKGRVVNRFYYRDRVIKDGRFKLFIGVDRQPKKLFELAGDPAETTNLVEAPPHASVRDQLLKAAHDYFEKIDAEPKYRMIPTNSWDLPINASKPPLTDPDAADRPLSIIPLK